MRRNRAETFHRAQESRHHRAKRNRRALGRQGDGVVMTENEKVTGFRPAAAQKLSDEEQARRVMAEATRLINLSPGEWKLWIGKSAERLAVSRADLEGLVKVILKHKERTERDAKAEDRRRQQRVAKQRAVAER